MSEQTDFYTWCNRFRVKHSRYPAPYQVWSWFQRHLRSEFDREAYEWILERTACLTGPQKKFALQHFERLHNGDHIVDPNKKESEEKMQPLIKGKSYSVGGYGPFIAGSESILIREGGLEVIEIKPVCGNCGGKGEVPKDANSAVKICNSAECTDPNHWEPCPDCQCEHRNKTTFEDGAIKCDDCGKYVEGGKPGERSHCYGCGVENKPEDILAAGPRLCEHRFVDERTSAERRLKVPVFYKKSNLVWTGHREGPVIGSIYIVDSRSGSQRRK